MSATKSDSEPAATPITTDASPSPLSPDAGITTDAFQELEPVAFRKENVVNGDVVGDIAVFLFVLLVVAVIIATFGREKIKSFLTAKISQKKDINTSVNSLRLSPKTVLHKVIMDESIIYVAESSVNVAINTEGKFSFENHKEEISNTNPEVED